MNKALFIPLVVWAGMTAIYGAALFAVGNFEVLSLIYHIGLLAVALISCKEAILKGIGYVKGKFKYGLLLVVVFTVYVLASSILHRTVPQFSFVIDLTTFSTVIFAPITEEIFWRGFIQQRMQQTKMEPLYIIFVNAILFAAMHIPKLLFFGEPLVDFVSLMGLGIVFSGTYYFTKSTYYSTAMHVINNLFAGGF